MLAVLPFENLGRPEDEYFADGMTDEIRGKLAALPNLRVIASSSAEQYRRTTKSPQEIGRELGVISPHRQGPVAGGIKCRKPSSGQPRAGRRSYCHEPLAGALWVCALRRVYRAGAGG